MGGVLNFMLSFNKYTCICINKYQLMKREGKRKLKRKEKVCVRRAMGHTGEPRQLDSVHGTKGKKIIPLN